MSPPTKGKKTWSEVIFRDTITPLFLMVFVPNIMICTMHMVVNYNSSVSKVIEVGFKTFWCEAWKEAGVGNGQAWAAVLVMAAWATFSIMCLCGETYEGPPTPNGFKPQYVKSGVLYYTLTVGILGIALLADFIPAWLWYKKLVSFAGALFVFGHIVCMLLFVKGLFAPSAGDYGSSGNPVFDYYWGLELYPRLGQKFDVKLFTNCRFGMMLWQIIVLISWKAQYEHSGWNFAMAASSILQSLFIAKFYYWEDGYMKTIDIMLDRAGFYICWGCIFFVPTFYTLTSTYMVENSPPMSLAHFMLLLVVGMVAVFFNYWPDYQRQLARATDGKCRIWGKPAKIIRAKYVDAYGKERQNVLLASGFWGLSRHINYVFEILVSFIWESPAGVGSLLPYIYGFYLIGLLTHRSFRDERKCKLKYGHHWDEYCKISRYQMIPYVF